MGKFFNGLVVLTMEIQCKKEYQVRFSIITVRRVAIIFSELGVVKNFMEKILVARTSWLLFCLKIVLDFNSLKT